MEPYVFHAYHINEMFKPKEVEKFFGGDAVSRSSTKLVYKDGEDSYFFIYRFGSIIFFNVDAARRSVIIEKLHSYLGNKADFLASEDYGVELSEDGCNSVGFEKAAIDGMEMDRLELLSFVLAQSTALEYFECKVDDTLGETAYIGHGLKKRGRLGRSGKEIKKAIGQCIVTKQHLVASLYLLDKPDEIWEDQALDKLYREAADMFELRDRYRTIDYKLRMVQENLELIADLLQHRHGNYLEWAIIILIAIEIILFVLQLFVIET